MRLPLSSAASSRLVVLESAGSTNAELLDAVGTSSPPEWPHLSAIVTTTQTDGRGRLGRVWTAPPGQALAVSVLLRPASVPASSWGWYPLIAGLAMCRAVGAALPGAEVSVKWPNDVLVAGLKVSGILTEVAADGAAVVVGAGLNLSVPRDGLPTSTSTSLLVEGATLSGDVLLDATLSVFLSELRTLSAQFDDADGDAERSGIRPLVQDACGSIGRVVEVQLPGGESFRGLASALDGQGRLVVRHEDGRAQSVAAGDVVHLR